MTMPSIGECRLTTLPVSSPQPVGIRLTGLQPCLSHSCLPRLTRLHPSHELSFGRAALFFVHALPSVCGLSTKSDYVKNGSNMLLMQLASGFSAGLSRKAFVMSFGQLLALEPST